MQLPSSITLCEVGLRDGLQNEKTLLKTEDKLALARDIIASGFPVVELSAASGSGLSALEAAVAQVLQLGALDGFAAVLVNERQRQCVYNAHRALTEAVEALQMGVTFDAVNVCVDEAIAALLETAQAAETRAVEIMAR